MAAMPPSPGVPKRSASNAVAIAALAIALLSGGRQEATRQLQPIQSLPPDVAGAVEDTWDRFAAAFPARLGCMASVRLELVEDVARGDARYLPEARLIEIEIPTSPRRFRESLVHELAHHLEAACPDQAEVRAGFAVAQGLAPQAGWFAGESWEAIPSEHFAEAVVQIVNGERVLHSDVMEIAPRALDVVRSWGAGSTG